MDKKTQSKRPRKGPRRSEGYQQKSNAVCVVAYDPGGKTMPDSVATEITNAVYEVAARNGYLISFTRT